MRNPGFVGKIATRWWIGLAAFLLLAAGAPAAPAAAAGLPAPIRLEDVPRFEQGPCKGTLPSTVDPAKDLLCGELVVPARYEAPGGALVRLSVVVIKARGESPAPDPVVFLQGGPGGSTIDYFTQVLFKSRLQTTRDFILFDQRGTLYSTPRLDCPEELEETIRQLPLDLPAADSLRDSARAAQACRERLNQDGVDLGAFNSLENARDIESLRSVLGYEQINLYGVSYGSQLAQHMMRLFPGSLRSVILDAVVPLEGSFVPRTPFAIDRAFTELFSACQQQDACRSSYPDLEKHFFDLVKRLNQSPVQLNLTDPDTGQTHTALLNGDSLVSTLFQMLYSTELIPLLPKMIDDVGAGRYSLLERILELIVFDRTMSTGMYYSVMCSEEVNFDPAAVSYDGVRPEISKDEVLSNQVFQQICKDWNVPALDAQANQPLRSDIPTLLFNGRFDPITPPSYGEQVAAGLSKRYLFTFPVTGHGALTSNECADRIAQQFLDDPTRAPDAACLAETPQVAFVTRADVVDLPFVARLLNLKGAAPLEAGLYLLFALFLLTGVGIYPLLWMIRMGRRGPAPKPEPAARLAPWTAVVTAVLVTAFGVLLLSAILSLVVSNNPIFLFGVAGAYRWIFFLPALIVLMALGMAVLMVQAWRKGYWTVWERLYFSAMTLAAAGCALITGLGGMLTALF